MLKSYEAIYDHGLIQWLGEVPRFKRVRVVLVADDSDELEEMQENQIVQANGSQLVAILRATPLEISASIAEKFGDAAIWQHEQRQERSLPGREEV